NQIVECDGAGNTIAFNNWKNGATASDTCSSAPIPTYVQESNTPGCGGTWVIKAHWTSTDSCGNAGTSVSRTFTVKDTTKPNISCPPDVRINASDSTDPYPLHSKTGMPMATDDCSGIPSSPSYIDSCDFPDDCPKIIT